MLIVSFIHTLVEETFPKLHALDAHKQLRSFAIQSKITKGSYIREEARGFACTGQ
jgi:hypothetical protein